MLSVFSREQQMNPSQHPPLATSGTCLLEQLQLVTREVRPTPEAPDENEDEPGSSLSC